MIKDIKEHLSYDPNTGEFTWLKLVYRQTNLTGTIAGNTNKNGYVYISFENKRYLAHRLAWFFEHGYLPENDIDHINRDRSDNRITNLRETSRSCNVTNGKVRADNKSGVKGVCWNKLQQKWEADVQLNKKRYRLGTFTDFTEAVAHRLAVEQCVGIDKCDSRTSAYNFMGV